MPQVKKEPYKTNQDVKAALNIIQDAAPNNGLRLRIIADLILHTGATLAEVLELTEENFINGENFTVEHNPNRSYSLRSYWSLPIVTKLRANRTGNHNKPFFSAGEKAFTDGYVRSCFTKLSSKTGYDVSLIRFQKTFYLDYLIRNGNLYDVAPAATRDSFFGDDRYIMNLMGLSEREYAEIKDGEWEPIIDQRQTEKYTDDLLEDTMKELEEALKTSKDHMRRLTPKGKEKAIVVMRWMIEQLHIVQTGGHVAFQNNQRGQ